MVTAGNTDGRRHWMEGSKYFLFFPDFGLQLLTLCLMSVGSSFIYVIVLMRDVALFFGCVLEASGLACTDNETASSLVC